MRTPELWRTCSERLRIVRALDPALYERAAEMHAGLRAAPPPPAVERALAAYLRHSGREAMPAPADRTAAAVQARRDLLLAYYCLCCPAFPRLGIHARMEAGQAAAAARAAGVSRKGLFRTYISPARHHYRIYPSYRREINGLADELSMEGPEFLNGERRAEHGE